jgi:DNA-binding CsgD family transcriptional regulator
MTSHEDAASGGSMADLTPRERRIAELVSEGMTNNEVGAALALSAKTVEAHLGRVYRKLGLRSRTELTRFVLTS